jgi:hypothetical protein
LTPGSMCALWYSTPRAFVNASNLEREQHDDAARVSSVLEATNSGTRASTTAPWIP